MRCSMRSSLVLSFFKLLDTRQNVRINRSPGLYFDSCLWWQSGILYPAVFAAAARARLSARGIRP